MEIKIVYSMIVLYFIIFGMYIVSPEPIFLHTS